MAIDNFYLSEQQLKDSPSRRDGIDEATEITLRFYGSQLIQESGILLRLSQHVIATAEVLFHRFYCKNSFSDFNVKKVAAGCVWISSKSGEEPRKGKHILIVFHRIECKRDNLPSDLTLDLNSKKYKELRQDLHRIELRILIEIAFIGEVVLPHKFLCTCLGVLQAPEEMRQTAWNLANDSLRSSLCVRFKSEVVACGVVYAAAHLEQIPLPERWWEAFNIGKTEIDKVCRTLALLHSLPKAKYLPVCKEEFSFTTSSQSQKANAEKFHQKVLTS